MTRKPILAGILTLAFLIGYYGFEPIVERTLPKVPEPLGQIAGWDISIRQFKYPRSFCTHACIELQFLQNLCRENGAVEGFYLFVGGGEKMFHVVHQGHPCNRR